MTHNQTIPEELSQIRSAVWKYIYLNMEHSFITKTVCPEKFTAAFTTDEGSKVKLVTYGGPIKQHRLIEIEGQVTDKPYKISLHDMEKGKWELTKISDHSYSKFYCVENKLYDENFTLIS